MSLRSIVLVRILVNFSVASVPSVKTTRLCYIITNNCTVLCCRRMLLVLSYIKIANKEKCTYLASYIFFCDRHPEYRAHSLDTILNGHGELLECGLLSRAIWQHAVPTGHLWCWMRTSKCGGLNSWTIQSPPHSSSPLKVYPLFSSIL